MNNTKCEYHLVQQFKNPKMYENSILFPASTKSIIDLYSHRASHCACVLPLFLAHILPKVATISFKYLPYNRWLNFASFSQYSRSK